MGSDVAAQREYKELFRTGAKRVQQLAAGFRANINTNDKNTNDNNNSPSRGGYYGLAS